MKLSLQRCYFEISPSAFLNDSIQLPLQSLSMFIPTPPGLNGFLVLLKRDPALVTYGCSR